MRLTILLITFFLRCELFADAEAESPPPLEGVEKLAAEIKPSLVSITQTNRQGEQSGMGTGFVASADGLIVTNFHVIGEGRIMKVETPGGRELHVTEVVAWSREEDLAVLRVEERELKALSLGPGELPAQGAAVVAMGNPLGFRYSVVEGVVSAVQEADGRRLIQVAMPIERGNSGGPLVNAEGRVVGIISMKSAVEENIGFAVPVAALQKLLENPTPVLLRNWMKIGALNEKQWTTTGANWSQRAGRIRVEGAGDGFGGRALCLRLDEVKDSPYEISVWVKLDDESGAAGLAFCADGTDVHYGFYPSAGNLRLTRFEGPDVNSWTVLREVASPHYRAGEWNHLKIRVEEEAILCLVNGREVVRENDSAFRSGRIGLCKFRQTVAEFREFKSGAALQDLPDEKSLAPLRESMQRFSGEAAGAKSLEEEMARHGRGVREVVDAQARELEKRAQQLRDMASRAEQAAARKEIVAALDKKEEEIDLGAAALLVARLENPHLDPSDYLQEMDRMADELRGMFTEEEKSSEAKRLGRLVRWMFSEQGFHPSEEDYYNKANSFLNEVMDDREGIPVTLGIFLMEMGRRLDLKIEGISLPGQFMVRADLPGDEADPYIDLMRRGKLLTKEEAVALIDTPLAEDFFKVASKRDIIARMLRNLVRLHLEESEARGMALLYVESILALTPEDAEHRLSRAILLYQSGLPQDARLDIEWLLERQPAGVDLDRLHQWLEAIQSESAAEK